MGKKECVEKIFIAVKLIFPKEAWIIMKELISQAPFLIE